jgi:hypothetical protein
MSAKRHYYAASKRSTTKHIIAQGAKSAACGRPRKGWIVGQARDFRKLGTCRGCLAAA